MIKNVLIIFLGFTIGCIPIGTPGQYTWWSNRGRAREKNVGWRLDYHVATPEIAVKAITESIYTAEHFSDHAPLIIDYDYSL